TPERFHEKPTHLNTGLYNYNIIESPGTSQLVISRVGGGGFQISLHKGNQMQYNNTLHAAGGIDYIAVVDGDGNITIHWSGDNGTTARTGGAYNGRAKVTFSRD
ncbi:MAG: hypothetical protein OXN94_01785, partial [Chloroflexota bacterium]|nr:hypothetical protein [Chloroflexota bacterium]